MYVMSFGMGGMQAFTYRSHPRGRNECLGAGSALDEYQGGGSSAGGSGGRGDSSARGSGGWGRSSASAGGGIVLNVGISSPPCCDRGGGIVFFSSVVVRRDSISERMSFRCPSFPTFN